MKLSLSEIAVIGEAFRRRYVPGISVEEVKEFARLASVGALAEERLPSPRPRRDGSLPLVLRS